MKKKLAALDVKVKLGLVALGLIVLAFAGHTFVVAPQGAESAKLQAQIDAQQTLTFKAEALARTGLHPPTIQVADLFRLARAMPDREDMPGIILTLSQVARSSGITLSSIAPSAPVADPAQPAYMTQTIALSVSGDFYSLSDFLYRLRSLVAVHHGKLQADGRLFNVENVTLAAGVGSFPQMTASLSIEAFVYVAPVAAPATTAPTTPTPSADPSLPSGATAAGVAP
jgi:Tfp pilus assembly protein PilO